MPERINAVFCGIGESQKFFSSSISRTRCSNFTDWSGRELYRQICARDSEEGTTSGENSRFENRVIDEQQQKLRWELQRILQEAHETNRALKHTA